MKIKNSLLFTAQKTLIKLLNLGKPRKILQNFVEIKYTHSLSVHSPNTAAFNFFITHKMINNIRNFFFLCSVLVFFVQCNNSEPPKKVIKIDKEKLKKQFEYANQRIVQKETDEMNYFEKTHQMPFIKTNFGVRYYVFDSIPSKRQKINERDEVTMNYTISLLDGTVCYTDEGKPKTFIVGGENIESGIHKIMPYLHYGDKAYILIPSALAHGLLGDLSKIPPLSPILYKVEIHPKKQ